MENSGGKISELNNLVNMIVDYYCFKSNAFDSEEQDENDNWKKGTKYESNEEIIPEKIDSLIEKSFIFQLNKFTKE